MSLRDLPAPQPFGPTPREVSSVAGTVLYIEDSPLNTMLVERILAGRPGVVFGAAADGRTGLTRAAQLHPDLVLLDLGLPDISGEEVLAELRAHPATSGIPVVVVTADVDPATQHRILAQGARGCLVKPFEVADLLGVVDRSLRAGRP